MKVVNVIEIRGKTYNFEELTEEQKKEIAAGLTKQAMNSIGYREVKETA